MRSWPLATTIGAAISPRRYSSATAKWVGLVTTTVAVLTACSMRRRAISRWMRRTRALISGLPSFASRFVADFLARHLQLREPAPALDAVVGAAEHDEREARPPEQASTAGPSRRAPTRPASCRRARAPGRRTRAHEHVADRADDGHADERLEQLGAGLRRLEPREAGRRAQPLPVRARAPCGENAQPICATLAPTETTAGDERRRTDDAREQRRRRPRCSVASAGRRRCAPCARSAERRRARSPAGR